MKNLLLSSFRTLLIFLFVAFLISAVNEPLGMRLPTNPTWLKFIPKTYIKGHDAGNKRVGTLLVAVRNYSVYQIGEDTNIDTTANAGQLYIKTTNARGTVKRTYLGYYRGRKEIDVWEGMWQSFTTYGINPKFSGSEMVLATENTVFFNRDTTKAWYFQLNKWSIPTKLEIPPQMFFPDKE